MHITFAQTQDIPALCDLLAILFAQEADFAPDRDTQHRGLTQIVGHPDVGHVFVARRDGGVAGMVSLLYTVSTALGGRVALMEDLVVAPAARRLGVGTQLLEHAVAWARSNGCLRVTVLTDRGNTAAQHLYQRYGFVTSAMVPMRLILGG
jgi:GNAT superfamily N-acetyltransferase